MDDGRGQGMPRWVKAVIAAGAAVALLLVVLALFGGGEHGPGRHLSAGGGEAAPAATVEAGT
ncbi:hypothetical protein O4J56_21235 [Nocardiopsis sp. RSe5-2]|uniref:Uncharacterized protein n=1 Tax=Nocardiopsis endophytica TaxID=3018445 RepID=A0ABT4U8A0_9ACTN|nr:hypothetical protein [Nocardiopsis endophytica]MDA2813183.1 hypothetical protein [Nocardiopsis endophytica]